MIKRIRYAVCCAAAALILAGTPAVFGQDLPNIIIIYADDLGYGDLSTYNPEAAYETPRLDRMAAEGIKFRTRTARRRSVRLRATASTPASWFAEPAVDPQHLKAPAGPVISLRGS